MRRLVTWARSVSTSWPAGEQAEAGKVTVILDRALEGRRNLVAGANREEYHLRNVTPGRDFVPTLTADVRNVVEGESCPQCPAVPGSPLKVAKAIEVGHIFKLGYRYSDGMGVRVLDPNGKEVTPIMGCYGIGIERILTAAIEQNHDAQRLLAGTLDCALRCSRDGDQYGRRATWRPPPSRWPIEARGCRI